MKSRDTTEEKILAAAQRVFIRKGMDGARMQEIADEAGINKALLHYYFRNKQNLFEAIFEKVFQKIFPNIRMLIGSGKPIEEKLGRFTEHYIDILLEHPFLPTFILREINRDPEFLAEQIKTQGIEVKELMPMLEKAMEEGKIRRMDPRDLVVNILGLSIFPFAAKPLLKIMLFKNGAGSYSDFLEKRKATVKTFLLHAILPEKKETGDE